MKWYETPLTEQWDAALELLNQGRAEAYVKALKRMHILCKEREKQQMHYEPVATSVLARYQGIERLLHMEQSKLRVMTDEDLAISRMGLMCDCAALVLNSDRPDPRENFAPAKQALGKILREMRRRTNVYNLDTDYWWM